MRGMNEHREKNKDDALATDDFEGDKNPLSNMQHRVI